jgi:hypothetical protein
MMRQAIRLTGRAGVTAGLIVLLPVTLVAAVAAGVAWWQGWPPSRLHRAAAWCLPMLAVWIAATVISTGSPGPLALAPWHALTAGHAIAAVVLVTPAVVPAGLLAGAAAWSRRLHAMASRAGGRSPAAAIAFDERQWRHQVRAAASRSAPPGAVPLLSRSGGVPVGATIRATGHRAQPLLTLPAAQLRAHQVVIGSTGTGKTTLMLRLWAGYLAAGLRQHAAGLAGPPAVIVLDCKGGADARRIADRFRRVLRAAGARNVAVWPDEARLSLWQLPPGQLVTTLTDLIEHGTGGAAYYADVLEAVVALAVEAPAGPPDSSGAFLSRLSPDWLAQAWAGDPGRLALCHAAARQLPEVALRFRTLFRRLGHGLDGPGDFAAADAWYCILEGTAEVTVAEAQARALVDLLAAWVTSRSAARPVLLAVDEFSAVSRRVPIWRLFERARSLGLTLQVSAQSWHGLADREDDRLRIASTAEGGIWLLRTPLPEPVIALAGQYPAVDSSRLLTGTLRWRRAGSSRQHDRPVAEPRLIRRLAAGQAALLHQGGATYVQVKRLVTGPVALPPAPVPAVPQPTPAQPAPSEAEPAAVSALPEVSAFLDAVFGPAGRTP